MEQNDVKALVSENLKNIFAFSIARLREKDKAEDLTNDIIYEILRSASRLKDDVAFYGFMWRIAENTYKKFLYKSSKQSVAFNEEYLGVNFITPESEYCEKEELNLLRRELSLLSKHYRETTVAYYIHGKSCSEISQELGISLEMVKYYLFKTRKILKEGIGMTREYGEKSYNPGTFRMDFWGNGDNSDLWKLFERKLPGNILLSAYYTPMTLQELSVELGVATVYLEDEIDLLMKSNMLINTSDKYQTNIVIFTDVYEKEVIGKISPIYTQMADTVNNFIREHLKSFQALPFKGNDFNENRLLWTMANLALVFGLRDADAKMRRQFGEYPLLSNGSHGFVYGYDNDYKSHHFHGIYGHYENESRTAYFSVYNYRAIERCQNWQPVNRNNIEAMYAAILEQNADDKNEMVAHLIEKGFISSENGKLKANFPVFDAVLLKNQASELLKPLWEQISAYIGEICSVAATIMKNHVPKALSETCDQLVFIKYQMDALAFVIETMIEKQYLTVPEHRENLTIFAGRR